MDWLSRKSGGIAQGHSKPGILELKLQATPETQTYTCLFTRTLVEVNLHSYIEYFYQKSALRMASSKQSDTIRQIKQQKILH
jgi:hypothetical protein